jgi:hypothetical protein
MCIVGGRGGIGKTSVTLEYLYRYGSSYSYLFWIDAESKGRCAERYAAIASILDTDEIRFKDETSDIFLVKECLARTDKRWLLVFDNVHSWEDVARFIPRSLSKGKGSVIITSREEPPLSIPQSYHPKILQLDALNLERGRELLLVSLEPGLTVENMRNYEEYELAAKVVSLVGCLPLAISIIVGYIQMSKCKLSEFIEIWEEKESSKKNRKKRISGNSIVEHTINSLWEIGIREIQHNCRRLLDVLSFLDPESIPKSLLVGDHKEKYLEFLHESEKVR